MHEYIFEVSKDAEQLFSIRNGFRTRIVRCRDCKKRLPKGWKFDKSSCETSAVCIARACACSSAMLSVRSYERISKDGITLLQKVVE